MAKVSYFRTFIFCVFSGIIRPLRPKKKEKKRKMFWCNSFKMRWFEQNVIWVVVTKYFFEKKRELFILRYTSTSPGPLISSPGEGTQPAAGGRWARATRPSRWRPRTHAQHFVNFREIQKILIEIDRNDKSVRRNDEFDIKLQHNEHMQPLIYFDTKRVSIFYFQEAKYVFERRFTAKHLTMFAFS